MDNSTVTTPGGRYLFSRRLGRVLIYVVLILGAFVSIVPFIWMMSASLMTRNEALSSQLITKQPLLERFTYSEGELDELLSENIPDFIKETDALGVHELKMTAREYAGQSEIYWAAGDSVYRGGLVNYIFAWSEGNFSEFLINSVQITFITLAGELIFSILAAYAFARINFPGRNLIFGILLSSMMIPGMVTMIPNFISITWFQRIGPLQWFDNWPALTIPFMGSVFAIFLLRQFFAQIPDDLFDAAQIDGASHWQFLWRIVLPLSKAPILVLTVLSFIGSWNALAWPLLVTKTPDWRPIAVGLYYFVDAEAGSWLNFQMAGAVVTIIPILILYFLTQRQFTESISRTGLKG
ncbi:MAG: carbohydrate ABC transporter permease [Anaerolineales bacterium]